MPVDPLIVTAVPGKATVGVTVTLTGVGLSARATERVRVKPMLIPVTVTITNTAIGVLSFRMFMASITFAALHRRHDSKSRVEWPIESLVSPIDRSIAVAANSVPVAHTMRNNNDRKKAALRLRYRRLQESDQDPIDRVAGLIGERQSSAPGIVRG